MAVTQFRWSRRGIVSMTAAVLAIGALLAVLWVRLLTAHQQVQAQSGSPLVGHVAPDFTLTLYGGTSPQKLHLADLKGHPVVINFWASWCGPCREESPILEAAWQKYQKDGVVIIGVDVQDHPDAAQAFLQQNGITYATGADDANGDIAIAYGVVGTPETAFVDRNGTVVKKVGGAVDDGNLDATIQQLLKT